MILPPVIFYFLGSLLMVFGSLRAYYFGMRRRERIGAGPDEAPEPRSKEQKRHIAMGFIWVIMGVVLIASTLRAPRPGRTEEETPASHGASHGDRTVRVLPPPSPPAAAGDAGAAKAGPATIKAE